MPWSPVPKFPGIVAELKRAGFTYEVGFEILKTYIMRETGVIRSETIKRIVQAMEQLGYIQRPSADIPVWRVCGSQPYRFPERHQILTGPKKKKVSEPSKKKKR